MKAWKHLLAAVVLTVGWAGTAAAQSSADPALLDAVTQAFEKSRAVASLHIERQSITEIAGAEFSLTQRETASFDAAQGADGWNLAGKQTTTAAVQGAEVTSTTETVILDGVVYLRLTGQRAGFPGAGGQNAPSQPEGWFQVEQPQDGQAMPTGLGRGGGMASANSALGMLLLPVSADSALAIKELASDTINGQAMRVFQVTVDPQAVLDAGFGGLLNAGAGLFGRQLNAAPNAEPPSAPDPNAAPPATPGAEGGFQGAPMMVNPENIQITFAVYIGQDDGYIHRIYSVVSSLSDAAPGQVTATSITDFSAFGAPVNITAPEIGS